MGDFGLKDEPLLAEVFGFMRSATTNDAVRLANEELRAMRREGGA